MHEAVQYNNDPAFINEVVRPINAQDGDLLKVSAFKGIEDGTWAQGTAKYEKRGVAAFRSGHGMQANCIQCNQVRLRLSSRFYPSVRIER